MINWNASREEYDLIRRIVDRFFNDQTEEEKQAMASIDRVGLQMDVAACHCNGCPLKLFELLNAPDLDFNHDLLGIHRHLDRKTGNMGGCFLPRYAVPENAAIAH